MRSFLSYIVIPSERNAFLRDEGSLLVCNIRSRRSHVLFFATYNWGKRGRN
jgi:hypothetical protein